MANFESIKTKVRELASRTSERVSRAWHQAEWPGKVANFTRDRVVGPIREKSKQWGLGEKFMSLLPQDLAKSFPKTFEPMAMAEWAGGALQRQGADFYLKAMTVVLSTYFVADVPALLLEKQIPEPPAARLNLRGGTARRAQTLEDLNVIFARNLFSSAGIIPGEEGPSTPSDMGGEPVKTSLPLNLIGTLILRDELKSIASIEDKTASLVYSVRMEDEIPGKIRVISVEAYKVIFINVSNGRREYVDLPQDASVTNPRVTVGGPKKAGGPGVERVSPTQFNVARTEVDKALSDLNQVLTQARAVPNFENGIPNGYKLFQIVPGSIYDKLGLQNGDTLCGINGAPINDPGKAFEMLGELKTASHLELCVKRDNKSSNFAYDIR